MKIKARDIPKDDGLVLQKTIAPSEIGLEAKDVACVSPLLIEGFIEKTGHTVLAHLTASAEYSFECGRCLEPVRLERKDDLEIVCQFQADTDIIDLGDELRQEIIVRTPDVIYCRPDCAGICAGCGVNLNHLPCRCSAKAGSIRMNI